MPDLSSTLFYILNRKNGIADQRRAEANAAANMLVGVNQGIATQQGEQAAAMGEAAAAAGQPAPSFDSDRLTQLAQMGAAGALAARQAARQAAAAQAERQKQLEVLRQTGENERQQLSNAGRLQTEQAGNEAAQARLREQLENDALQRTLDREGRAEVARIYAGRPHGQGGRPDLDASNPLAMAAAYDKQAKLAKDKANIILTARQRSSGNPNLMFDNIRDDPELKAAQAEFAAATATAAALRGKAAQQHGVSIVPPGIGPPPMPTADGEAGAGEEDPFQESLRRIRSGG